MGETAINDGGYPRSGDDIYAEADAGFLGAPDYGGMGQYSLLLATITNFSFPHADVDYTAPVNFGDETGRIRSSEVNGIGARTILAY